MTRSRKFLLLLLALALVYAVEWSASAFTQSSANTWYTTLEKPSWTPPKLAFPIVWTLLYTLIALSFWLILCDRRAYKTSVFVPFFVQLTLNFTWSFAFFYLRSSLLGLFNIGLLLAAILWTIVSFRRFSRWAAWLLVPYFFWVVYASALNLRIWMLN